MKKTLILLVIIVLLCAAWFSGWFYVAGKVEETIAMTKERLASQDRIFQCPNQEIGGFPFRINLNCAETTYIDNRQGFSFEAGALRSAAQAYQPNKAVVEIDGPAVMIVRNRETYDVDWQSLRSSVTLGLSGVETFSTVGRTLSVKPALQIYDPFTIDELQLHSRKAEANDVDFAAISRKVVSQSGLWPDFDLTLNLRFAGIYDRLVKQPDLTKIARESGLTGQITELRYTASTGGDVTVTGPMQVDANGLLSGKFKVKVTQIRRLLAALSKSFPQQQEIFQQAGIAAGLLGGGHNGGELELPITVRKGQASLGIIPIGNIPPVF